MAAPSPAPKFQQEVTEVPLKMVGSNLFGRYPKISDEQTYNFIISDDALVPYAGYKQILQQNASSIGRGIYASPAGNIMLVVWGSQCYIINSTVTTAKFVGNLTTTAGDVYIAENNNHEIAFTDGVNIYVYNWSTQLPIVKLSSLDGSLPASLSNPGYISFQNQRLIVVNNGSQNWYLSEQNNAQMWTADTNSVGVLQSKPGFIQAAVPAPGGGNNLYLFGDNVVEQWQDINSALFPYQRASTFNVDYGTLNASSIAAMDEYVVWVSANELSGAALMIVTGTKAQKISTDGIDFKLANLSNPTNCTGFLFRQDGHILYQFTFPDDNLSYVYDINTSKFFTVTDENLNYHIAHNVVYFNDNYYFVSLNGGNLYQFGTEFTDLDYGNNNIQQIPRIRICPPIRLQSQRMFIIKSIGFTIENGQENTITDYSQEAVTAVNLATENLLNLLTEDGRNIILNGTGIPGYFYQTSDNAVDLSISRDGGETFGNSIRLNMNSTGQRRSRFIWQRCGQANDLTIQFRFSGLGRFVAFEGIAEIYV